MTPLQVIRFGEGPPLAIVHGWGFGAATLRSLAESLARRRTVELVELPGHGGSRGLPMPDHLQGLAAQLDATLPDTRDWLGWSLGGLACLQLALARPERFGRLVLLATTPRFTATEAWPDALPPDTLDAFRHDLARDVATTLNRFAGLVAHGDDAERSVRRVLRTVLAAGGQPDPDALATGLELLARSDLTSVSAALRVPSLWLLGARDTLVPAGVAGRLASWPQARVEVLDGACHAPFLSALAPCTKAVEAFLDA
ncbi:MAG: alpha/beta fold hydrolase [Gammaproteobacteria bacterium]|nr:alpha/beta fold hydrolase [Gammaproteobacteria bacterium]